MALAAVFAGELVVTTPSNAEVYVDRASIPNTPDGRHVARGLQAGMHEIEIRVGSRIVDNLWVEVPQDARQRVEWAPGASGAVFSVFAPEGRAQRPQRPPQRPAGPPPPRGPQPMDPAAFSGFRSQIAQASFDSGRLGMLQTAASHNVFVADQVKALLKTFDFDSKRVEAACMLAPRTLDVQNAHVIGTSFDFDSKRNEALACFR